MFVFQVWGRFILAADFHPNVQNARIIQMISYYAAGFNIQTWPQVQTDTTYPAVVKR